jgi:tetratricopeptide (TPR) repeat protein
MSGSPHPESPLRPRDPEDPIEIHERAMEALVSACAAHLERLAVQIAPGQTEMAAALAVLQRPKIPLGDADALYRVIVVLVDRGRTEDALNVATVAMMQSPADHRFTLAAASCQRALEQPEQALPLYLASLLAKPTAAAADGCGRCYLSLGKPEGAVAQFAAARELALATGDPQAAARAEEALASLGAS